jgi:hypothetical protein
MSLEDYKYRISALNKASAPYEKTTKSSDGNMGIMKYKKYIIAVVIIFLLLIIIKPKWIQGRNAEGNADNKIKFSALLKYWIIFSLFVCVALYVYCNVICKKKGSDSVGCKRCSG